MVMGFLLVRYLHVLARRRSRIRVVGSRPYPLPSLGRMPIGPLGGGGWSQVRLQDTEPRRSLNRRRG